jgi:hypothetical protein
VPDDTDPTPDFVNRLADAAREAVENERPSLSYEPARVRGVVVELEVNAAGAIVDGRAFVERPVTAPPPALGAVRPDEVLTPDQETTRAKLSRTWRSSRVARRCATIGRGDGGKHMVESISQHLTEQGDLVGRLADAAADVVRNERPGLAYQPERMRGVVIELELDSTGVVGGTCYIERRVRSARGTAPGAR